MWTCWCRLAASLVTASTSSVMMSCSGLEMALVSGVRYPTTPTLRPPTRSVTEGAVRPVSAGTCDTAVNKSFVMFHCAQKRPLLGPSPC